MRRDDEEVTGDELVNELINEERVYKSFPAEFVQRKLVPEFYWRGDLQPGWVHCIVLEFVEGRRIASRASAAIR